MTTAAKTTKGTKATTLTGGALYREALCQLAKANGYRVSTEGYVDTFTKGTVLLVAKSASNGVLVSMIDKAGNPVVKPNTALRWEAAAQLLTTGKLVPATVKPVVLNKAQREAVTAGKFTSL